jgi:hypothetical protein
MSGRKLIKAIELVTNVSESSQLVKYRKRDMVAYYSIVVGIVKMQRLWLATRPGRIDNEECPLTLESFAASTDPVFVRTNAHGYRRGFHAESMIRCILAEGKFLDPIDREELTLRDLRRLDLISAHHNLRLAGVATIKSADRQAPYSTARVLANELEVYESELDISTHNACVDVQTFPDPGFLAMARYRSFYSLRMFLIAAAHSHGRAAAYQLAVRVCAGIKAYRRTQEDNSPLTVVWRRFLGEIVFNIMRDIGAVDSDQPLPPRLPLIPSGMFADDTDVVPGRRSDPNDFSDMEPVLAEINRLLTAAQLLTGSDVHEAGNESTQADELDVRRYNPGRRMLTGIGAMAGALQARRIEIALAQGHSRNISSADYIVYVQTPTPATSMDESNDE